jgi:hypothetical protein
MRMLVHEGGRPATEIGGDFQFALSHQLEG